MDTFRQPAIEEARPGLRECIAKNPQLWYEDIGER